MNSCTMCHCHSMYDQWLMKASESWRSAARILPLVRHTSWKYEIWCCSETERPNVFAETFGVDVNMLMSIQCLSIWCVASGIYWSQKVLVFHCMGAPVVGQPINQNLATTFLHQVLFRHLATYFVSFLHRCHAKVLGKTAGNITSSTSFLFLDE